MTIYPFGPEIICVIMKKRFLFMMLFVAGFIILSQYGCSKNSDTSVITPPPQTTDCTGINPSFSTDVLPLIQTKCAINSDCHATGSTNSGGPFTNFSQVSAKASNIKAQVSAGTMPKSGSITPAQKATLICWVNNGASNN